MGAFTELNTIVRFPAEYDFASLTPHQVVTLTLDHERVLPLRIALLYFHSDWNFLGYCRVLSTQQKNEKTYMEVEILTIFNPEEKKLYKQKFIEAGRFTGEAK